MGRPGGGSSNGCGYLGGDPSSSECHGQSSTFAFVAETGGVSTEHGTTTGRAQARYAGRNSCNTGSAGPRKRR
jgi:hypothetical protein